jgi:CGNR zinc finger/Putative stress-induced transcription regulator
MSMPLAARTAALTALLAPRGEPAAVPATAVAAVLRKHGEPEPITISRTDLADMQAVAARLHEVFAAPDAAAAARLLNAILADAAGPPRLSSHDGTPWHLHLDSGDDAPWGEWFAASSAAALAELLASRQAPPGGLCAAAGCGRPFAHLGGGTPRRYCSARCATRERVAAHRRARTAG